MEHLLIITTCPDLPSAEAVANHLVREHLAACVNIVPGIRSVYEWQGELRSEQEFMLIIKTRADAYDRVESAVRQKHPYELPEVIAVSTERGSTEYLAWIDSLVNNKP